MRLDVRALCHFSRCRELNPHKTFCQIISAAFAPEPFYDFCQNFALIFTLVGNIKKQKHGAEDHGNKTLTKTNHEKTTRNTKKRTTINRNHEKQKKSPNYTTNHKKTEINRIHETQEITKSTRNHENIRNHWKTEISRNHESPEIMKK